MDTPSIRAGRLNSFLDREPPFDPIMLSQPAHADIQFFLEIAHRIADGADQRLHQGWGRAIASEKADGTLVTQTDFAVDAYITQQLTQAFPDHAILSEERNTLYAPTHDFTWVVDPLDGTTNFARGLAIWGVSIALLWRGQPLVGVLSFVSLHERYAAARGRGASLNDVPIHTSPLQTVDDQHFLMICTRSARRYHIDTPLKPRILGSAAYHIAAVAHGSALAGVEATPKLWDIAAALLLLNEAGGVYTSLAPNKGIFPLAQQPANFERISFPILVAANQSILTEVEPTITHAQY